jgi:pimeloyl-ACP methyl ester carboxylesterase
MGSVKSLARTDLVPRLGALAVPTLVIGTDEDRIIAPEQASLVPTPHRSRIPHTGHMPMLERPQEFNRALDAFLRSARV